jgi:hypothetical protein
MQFTPTEVQQQVFTLSSFINKASKTQMNPGQLQALIDSVAANIGPWNVAWGPQYTFPSNSGSTDNPQVVDNAMFVAQAVGTAQPTYVVAIAGTIPQSIFDWASEDLNIQPMDWPYSSAGQVTTGDATGLANLLSMSSTSGSNTSQTLQEFLGSIPDKSGASLTFTGHSLGGALAPMLTLALMDPASSLNSTNDVSVGSWGEVSLLATAGPSIGDSTFVQYFNTVLADASCTFIWNGNDIVPHAWNKGTMMELTLPSNIYNLDLESGACLATQIAQYQTKAATYDYTQFEQTPAFFGPLQPYTGFGWLPGSKFLAQAVYQHINAYSIAFNCSWIQDPASVCNEPLVAGLLLADIDRLCL